MPTILSRVAERKFALLIFDPVYKLLGGMDENKSGDIARLLNELERIAVLTGAAVAFGAHYSKGNQAGKEPMDRIGGSGVFARDPDSILTLTRHEAQDAFTVDPTLRNHSPIEPFVMRWKYPLMERDDALDPKKLKVPIGNGGRQPKYSEDQVLGVLAEAGELEDADWCTGTIKKTDMSERTFYNYKKTLVRKEKVIESKVTPGVWMVK